MMAFEGTSVFERVLLHYDGTRRSETRRARVPHRLWSRPQASEWSPGAHRARFHPPTRCRVGRPVRSDPAAPGRGGTCGAPAGSGGVDGCRDGDNLAGRARSLSSAPMMFECFATMLSSRRAVSPRLRNVPHQARKQKDEEGRLDVERRASPPRAGTMASIRESVFRSIGTALCWTLVGDTLISIEADGIPGEGGSSWSR